MTRTLAKLIPILVLAACGTALPKGEAVPIQKVLSDTRGLPYECVNYDAASDSCAGIARRSVRGMHLCGLTSLALVVAARPAMIKLAV